MPFLALLFSTLCLFVSAAPGPASRQSTDVAFRKTVKEIEQWSSSAEVEVQMGS